MLMNLTRMRAFSWTDYVVPIYKEYKLKITWGDQDIINIIFHFHPGNFMDSFSSATDHCGPRLPIQCSFILDGFWPLPACFLFALYLNHPIRLVM
jgi:hypothetical protein